MKLSELEQKANELAQYEEVRELQQHNFIHKYAIITFVSTQAGSTDVVTKFNTLKQNLPAL